MLNLSMTVYNGLLCMFKNMVFVSRLQVNFLTDQKHYIGTSIQGYSHQMNVREEIL